MKKIVAMFSLVAFLFAAVPFASAGNVKTTQDKTAQVDKTGKKHKKPATKKTTSSSTSSTTKSSGTTPSSTTPSSSSSSSNTPKK